MALGLSLGIAIPDEVAEGNESDELPSEAAQSDHPADWGDERPAPRPAKWAEGEGADSRDSAGVQPLARHRQPGGDECGPDGVGLKNFNGHADLPWGVTKA